MTTTHKPRRGIGRPRPSADAHARERLLDAAVSLFAERGIAATTIADIARKADVTPAMVHYYFTNRERLIDAIAGERLVRTVVGVWSPVAETDDVSLMVRGLIQRIIEATERHPWLPSLWLREIVSEGGHLRQRMLKALPFEYVKHLIDAVARERSRGRINKGVDPRLVFVSVIGMTLLPLATMRLWHQVALLSDIGREDIGRHAEAILLQGLSAVQRRAARGGGHA